ncbi:hypothetical protein ACJJTC_009034 [Scirpophaga incertulas]
MNLSLCLLQAIAFLDLLAVGLIVPLLPGHIRKMGANHIYVGLLGSIYAGFQLCSGPLIGSLSDLKGRKFILIFTLLVSSVAYTIMGLVDSIVIILILRAILGLFKQTQMLTKALVPDYEKSKQVQSSAYGRMAAISGAGITVGPVIGGHIAEDMDPENGFIFIAFLVGICFVINAGLVYFLPKPLKTHRKRQKKNMLELNILYSFYNNIKMSVLELFKIEWTDYWDIFTFKALVGFAMGVYYSNYALYLKTQFELTPKYIGYVISFQGVIGSVSSFFMGSINDLYKHDTDYSLRNLHVFILLTLSLLGIIISHNVYMYVIWLIPLAIGNAVGRLITLEMILRRCHGDHRGTLIGASNSVRSITGVVSPMVAGLIGQYFGVSYVIYASLLSTSVGLAMGYTFRKRRLKID